MNSRRIDYYCYRHHYFTVCALQVISFIVSSIQSTIVCNSNVIAVVCFELIKLLWYSIHFIFLTHSHSYFITEIYYFHFIIYQIPTTNFTLKSNYLLLENCHRNEGKSSCYVDTDTIEFFSTC